MLRRALALLTIAGLGVGCTTTTGTSTTTTSEPTSSATIVTTVPHDDSIPTTETTRGERTETTRLAFDFDMPIESDGVEYLLPSAICAVDAEGMRSILNQLMSSTQRSVESLASGWPTTTMPPDLDAARSALDQLAIVATAVAVHEDRLGILEQRWADLNEEYSQLEGAVSGPIDAATIAAWEQAGRAVAEQIDAACDALG